MQLNVFSRNTSVSDLFVPKTFNCMFSFLLFSICNFEYGSVLHIEAAVSVDFKSSLFIGQITIRIHLVEIQP